MPEEAFALSPISARPSLPSEADYEAIREAFMETSRGRWFLAEYAKRNRNADTRMVLDAVDRIEQSLASQKKSNATGLVDALGAISALISETKATVAKALPDPTAALSAVGDGARITREVANALRECGADVRICDLLDAQVHAIEAGRQQIGATAARDAVLAAFDRLLQGVVDLASGKGGARAAPVAPAAAAPRETAPPPAPPSAPVAAASAVSEDDLIFAEPEAAAEPLQGAAMEAEPEPAIVVAEAAIQETATVAAFAEPTPSQPPEAAIDPDAPTLEQIIAEETASDADFAHDIAVLDMVAQEMAAADDDDMPDFDLPEDLPPVAAESPAVAPVAAPAPQPAALAPTVLAPTVSEPAVVAVSEPPRAVAASPQPPVASVPPSPVAVASTTPASDGDAALAHGVVRKPILSGDPLAAIRRMTQAEKLAFFS